MIFLLSILPFFVVCLFLFRRQFNHIGFSFLLQLSPFFSQLVLTSFIVSSDLVFRPLLSVFGFFSFPISSFKYFIFKCLFSLFVSSSFFRSLLPYLTLPRSSFNLSILPFSTDLSFLSSVLFPLFLFFQFVESSLPFRRFLPISTFSFLLPLHALHLSASSFI